MSKIIWTLIKGLDGHSIDTGDDRFDNSGFGKNTEGRTVNALWGDKGEDATKRATKVFEDARNDRSMRASGASAGVSVMMSASQTLNHHTANKAENRALAALEPRVHEHLPHNYGGVIVVSVFRIINTGRMFSNAYVASWAPTPETGLSCFRNRGTISAPNTDMRIYFATLAGAKMSPGQILEYEKRTRLMR